ncbi:AarF/ABC1/UbiB kinase family protein [Gordonia sp. CPCC 205333]
MASGRMRRGATLGRLAARQAARGAGTRLSMIGRSDEARAILAQRSTLRAAEQLVAVLGNLKGAAMKAGQMFALIDLDLLPESHRADFQAKLAALFDSAPQVAFDEMREVIESDLGPLASAFAEFDTNPIGAASIGQVYRARLHDGRRVAVKVKYPGVDRAVRSDMRNLALFGKLFTTQWPTIKNGALVEEFTSNLERELDYVGESRTQRAVAREFVGHPHIVIPDVVEEMCTDHVLVSELFDGESFESLRQLPPEARNHYGELIYRFYVGSLFERNEFCGDPHPGNILIGGDGKICFLDFGLYHRMTPDRVEEERQMLRAAASGDSGKIRRLMVAAGVFDESAPVTANECLSYIWGAAEWHLADEEIAIDPTLATGTVLLALDPRSREHQNIRRQNLPPEHMFSRRTDFLTFGVLGQLRVSNNWHRIAREWLFNELPATDIGNDIALWRESRSTKSEPVD